MQQRKCLMAVVIAVAMLAGTSIALAQATVADCMGCHNDTTLITGKQTAWDESGHGTGTAYVRGTSASCAGCHSGGGFSAMVPATRFTPATLMQTGLWKLPPQWRSTLSREQLLTVERVTSARIVISHVVLSPRR